MGLIDERLTIAGLLDQLDGWADMDDGFPLPQNWTLDFQYRRRSLISSNELVTDLFDGGETIIRKVYDEQDRQRVWEGNGWGFHQPGGPARASPVSYYEDGALHVQQPDGRVFWTDANGRECWY